MGIKIEGITGELQAFSCFDKPDWLQDAQGQGVPWLDNESLQRLGVGTRQHAFKNVWEQTLDPLGKKRLANSKTSKPETWTIDWKRWPPNVPVLPKGLKIPVTVSPQVDLRLSMSGKWHQIAHGMTIVPVNYAPKKLFDDLGGYLNLAQSRTFLVNPPSLMFLHAKPGQFYSVKLKLHNSGTVPRRIRLVPPINACFTIVRPVDPKYPISPGCGITLTVQYRPTTNTSLNDVLIIHIDGDGGIIVPLISACTPNPILEFDEWNCGCSTVGIPRTAYFEIKNIGGPGRFWLLSEEEFNNQYLECFLQHKRDLIKESTKELVKRHTTAIIGEKPVGRGEAMGLIKRHRDSMDDNDDDSNAGRSRHHNRKSDGAKKIKPRIYTKCFRIQPSCFRLQRNQKIEIKVRYHPKDANFHYEKLAVMCENGEVRWIAVKGLGIDRDSDKLVEIKAPWTGPPVDLPTDPRTKYILDCGDLISGEFGILNFSVVNKSCIPLYFFWSIRPVLTNPEESPENTEIKLMERFYESTLYDQDGNSFFMGEIRENKDLNSWVSLLPLTVNPAQGVLEKKQEIQMSFTAECPASLGYHACVISLFVEQIDEESKNAVVATLQELDKAKLVVPISHVDLSKELPEPVANIDDQDVEIEDEPELNTLLAPVPPSPIEELEIDEVEPEDAIDIYENEETEEEDENEGFIPFSTSIKESRASLGGGSAKDEAPEEAAAETLLPLAVANKRSKLMKAEGKGKGKKKGKGKGKSTTSQAISINKTEESKRHSALNRNSDVASVKPYLMEEENEIELEEEEEEEETLQKLHKPKPIIQTKEVISPPKSGGSGEGSNGRLRYDSLNIHFLPENFRTEYDRDMNQGHGVYEDLKNYTENVIPVYQMWPNRDKILTPVAEVEIWMQSVPLEVTFSPPFILANGPVKTSLDKLVTVKNGTRHNIEVAFDNMNDSPIAVTCHPTHFSVKPGQKFTFKLMIYFEKCGEVRRLLKGTITLPFTKVPCAISTLLKAHGPFLEVLTPTLNFGLNPLASESMKTLGLKNNGDRPLKWIARVPVENMEDENKRKISGHQGRIYDKRLVRIWPEWGVLDAGESAGLQVYFCAELNGEVASYVEIMVEGNPESLVSVPVYGEIELPYLVLEHGRILFDADSFLQQPIQHGTCTIINPSGFNVAFKWQCPVGRQCKLASVEIEPRQGIVPSKSRMDFNITVESYLTDDPLELNNLFIPCCVEGMREPLILKIES